MTPHTKKKNNVFFLILDHYCGTFWKKCFLASSSPGPGSRCFPLYWIAGIEEYDFQDWLLLSRGATCSPHWKLSCQLTCYADRHTSSWCLSQERTRLSEHWAALHHQDLSSDSKPRLFPFYCIVLCFQNHAWSRLLPFLPKDPLHVSFIPVHQLFRYLMPFYPYCTYLIYLSDLVK